MFLGYSLRDWNLRAILHQIWGSQKFGYNSWAIQKNADRLDKKFWEAKDVDILDTDVDEYIIALSEELQALKAPAPPTTPGPSNDQ